ncbi:hypothetical protein D7V97_03365 [Corallococcus sp. CA053C]|uniref:hypothetical protein n=1 Tax=Corallococcus sp. CA053C TaxID=2316732 RepID=UPI000EA1DAEB|nr:hypothetical protein [Corallococcus sp. CA053C]RKH14333.1 hypothetical protein D7V97_03365 [Corallococcus sp. CA053C]
MGSPAVVAAPSVREGPILFSGPMICALVAGRKTITRRLVKPQPETGESIEWLTNIVGRPPSFAVTRPMSSDVRELRCPYGQPGDRLWVRETWGLEDGKDDGERVVWQADRAAAWRSNLNDRFYLASDYAPTRWRPSIHMPRWASRLTLDVASVRVERLHDITEEDAKAEGLACITKDGGRTWKYGIPDRDGLPGTDDTGWPWVDWDVSPRVAFERLWSSINGAESWDANPWVWRIEFRQVEVSR